MMKRYTVAALIAPLYVGTMYLAQAQAEKPVALDKRYETEIQNLAKRPAVQSALKTFMDMESQTKQDLINLTETPSPPFKEQVRAKKYAEMMKAAGADSVWLDDVSNELALRRGKGGKKTVMVEAHLDTVFPEGTDVKVKQRGDTLY